MYNLKKEFYILAGITLATLTACGGGSSEPETRPINNISPIVTVENIRAQENTTVSLTANGQDSDGSIQSYLWSQVSGSDIELLNSTTATVSFIAPLVIQDEVIVLSVNVTDNEGATASTNVAVTVLANILTINLEGLIANSFLDNTQVNVSVGQLHFSTTADENGLYTIDISTDDSLINQLVTITATSPDNNDTIKLVSILGTFDNILNSAGADRTVTKDEFFAVNVTSLTTVTAALLESTNNNLPITTLAQLTAAYQDIPTSLILPYATIIKLVIDFSDDTDTFQLPEGIDNTFSFIKNRSVIQNYASDTINDFNQIYEQARTEILANNNIISGEKITSISDVSNTYYSDSQRLELFNDGTGYISQISSGHNLNWNTENEVLNIQYGNPGWIQSRWFVRIPDINSSVEELKIITDSKIRLLNQIETNVLYLIENSIMTHYPGGEVEDSISVQVQLISALKESSIIHAENILIRDALYSFPFSPQIGQQILGTDRVLINNIGSIDTTWISGGTLSYQLPTLNINGETGQQTVNSTWQIDSRGHLLTNINNQAFDIVFLQKNNGKYPVISITRTTEDFITGMPIFASVNQTMLLEEEQWTSDTVTGIYRLDSNFDSSLSRTWNEFNQDGSGMVVRTRDSNHDNLLSSDEFSISPFYWSINNSENLILRYGGGFFGVPTCDAGGFDNNDTNCPLLLEEEIDLHQIDAQQSYLVRRNQRAFSPSSGELFFGSNFNETYGVKTLTRPHELPSQ